MATTNSDQLLLGADPEVFVKKLSTGKIVPVTSSMIQGDKNKHQIYKELHFHRDNVMAEFNTEPAADQQSFIETMSNSLYLLDEYLQEFGCRSRIKASHRFKREHLLSAEAMEFGCSPDVNAWLGEPTPPIKMDDVRLTRLCGGHIHIQLPKYIKENERNVNDFVLLLDLYLGTQSVLDDKDNVRRKFYGSSSRYRRTSYGIEYRVLSNFWINDVSWQSYIWDKVQLITNNFTHFQKKYTTFNDLEYNRELSNEILYSLDYMQNQCVEDSPTYNTIKNIYGKMLDFVATDKWTIIHMAKYSIDHSITSLAKAIQRII